MNFNFESNGAYNSALTNLSIYDYIDLNISQVEFSVCDSDDDDDNDDEGAYCSTIDCANLY